MCGSFVYTFPQGKLCCSLPCTSAFICQKPRKDDFSDLEVGCILFSSLNPCKGNETIQCVYLGEISDKTDAGVSL